MQTFGWPGNGIRFSGRVGILVGIGDPNNSATPDVQIAGAGSLFLQTDAGTLWVCSVSGVTNPNGPTQPATWIAK